MEFPRCRMRFYKQKETECFSRPLFPEVYTILSDFDWLSDFDTNLTNEINYKLVGFHPCSKQKKLNEMTGNMYFSIGIIFSVFLACDYGDEFKKLWVGGIDIRCIILEPLIHQRSLDMSFWSLLGHTLGATRHWDWCSTEFSAEMESWHVGHDFSPKNKNIAQGTARRKPIVIFIMLQYWSRNRKFPLLLCNCDGVRESFTRLGVNTNANKLRLSFRKFSFYVQVSDWWRCY